MSKRDRTVNVARGVLATVFLVSGSRDEKLAECLVGCTSRDTDRVRFAAFILRVGKKRYDLIITPKKAELREVPMLAERRRAKAATKKERSK